MYALIEVSYALEDSMKVLKQSMNALICVSLYRDQFLSFLSFLYSDFEYL